MEPTIKAMHGPMRLLGPHVSTHSSKCTAKMVAQSANAYDSVVLTIDTEVMPNDGDL